jgi:hypothetical protein
METLQKKKTQINLKAMQNQAGEFIPAYRIGQREVVKKVVNEETGRESWKVDLEVYDKKDEEV